MKLDLEAKTKEQELVKAYLEENASEVLAEKINSGVRIEKDGKTLINNKSLDGFMKYASSEARKLASKGANSACVEDKVVYGWAVHYFEEDAIEGTLYNEDGSEYKPAPKVTDNPVVKPVQQKKSSAQISMLDFEEKEEQENKDEKEDWVVIENAHEPIISKELWNKVKEVEASVSNGKPTKRGFTHPLSGLLFCADCGAKMRLGWNMPKDIPYFNFNCGTRSRCGSSACFSHFITVPALERIVLNDVRDKAQKIVADERKFRRKYMEHTAKLADKKQTDVKRELKRAERRSAELDKLISAAFKEKVAGNLPENVCLQLIDKYTAEQTELKERISALTQGLKEKQRATADVDEFIRRMKKHINAPELTRELCLELFEKIVIGGKETVTGKLQEVHIYYKIDIGSIFSPYAKHPSKQCYVHFVVWKAKQVIQSICPVKALVQSFLTVARSSMG